MIVSRVFGVMTIALLLTSCNTMGPRAVRGARISYNDAVAQSWKQQLLLNLVRMKYRDTPLFLEVSSVTTQYNVGYGLSASSLWAQPGVRTTARALTTTATGITSNLSRTRQSGSNTEYDAGVDVAFYERPTIMYTPLQGKEYVTQIMTPMSLDALILLSQSGWSIERIMLTCVQRMNRLANAPSASGPTPDYAPKHSEFARAAEIMRELQKAEVFEFRVLKEGQERRVVLHFKEDADHAARVEKLKELLDLPQEQQSFPLTDRWFSRQAGEIGVQLRSVLSVLFYLANAVEAPASHREAGWVTKTESSDGTLFDWSEVTGDLLRIQSQNTRPSDAFVSARYEDHWFFIEKGDLPSKTTFGFLSMLFYLQAGEIDAFGPTLTLPAGQ